MIQTKVFHQQANRWIHMSTDDPNELQKFYQEYGVSDEVTAYSLDKNERARLEYDEKTETLILIFNVPMNEKIENHYETVPMTFILKKNTLMTITNAKNAYIATDIAALFDQYPDITIYESLFRALFVCTDHFFPYIEEIEHARTIVHQKLKQKTSKQNLLLLSDLEIGIVFYVSASKQNAALIEQVRAHDTFIKLTHQEKAQLETVRIESKQLYEMTEFSDQILKQLSGTYNNILNNTLNETMRILTILSVLLTIPTIITGFFGMNMPLPLEHNAFGWLITIVLSTALWFLLSWILRKWMD